MRHQLSGGRPQATNPQSTAPRRLSQPKTVDEEGESMSKLEKMQLKYDGAGKEKWVPVKKVGP